MEMRKCTKGHYYDASLYASCPYCQQQNGTPGGTMPLSQEEKDQTVPLGFSQANSTSPVSQERTGDDDGPTQALFIQKSGIDPAVGWLVAITGKGKGRDYRIHADNNFIGRADNMDICIREDSTVSRERHAIVSYDTRNRTFYFSPGDGRSIVRVNDNAIFQTVMIKPYDRLTVGETDLIFVPLCGPNFDWNDKNSSEKESEDDTK